jgi:hypothetical protein
VSEALPVKGRHLLMIATGHTGDSDKWPDLDVDAETRVWVDWLTDPDLGDRAFTVAYEDLAHSPTKKRLNEVLEARDFDRDRDVVVCYITGHGEQHNREHRLILSTSVPGDPSSMLRTSQVLEWLMARVNRALVVVDTCYSGEVAAYLASLDRDVPDGWIVISAASAHQLARLGLLTKAVREFVGRRRCPCQPPRRRQRCRSWRCWSRAPTCECDDRVTRGPARCARRTRGVCRGG